MYLVIMKLYTSIYNINFLFRENIIRLYIDIFER